MSNLQVIQYWAVPIIAYISAFICFAIDKNNTGRDALRWCGISLLIIAIAWTLPLITEYVVSLSESEDKALGLFVDINNAFAPILLILGHALLAMSFYKFKYNRVK